LGLKQNHFVCLQILVEAYVGSYKGISAHSHPRHEAGIYSDATTLAHNSTKFIMPGIYFTTIDLYEDISFIKAEVSCYGAAAKGAVMVYDGVANVVRVKPAVITYVECLTSVE
jgi:hypothetical protein